MNSSLTSHVISHADSFDGAPHILAKLRVLCLLFNQRNHVDIDESVYGFVKEVIDSSYLLVVELLQQKEHAENDVCTA